MSENQSIIKKGEQAVDDFLGLFKRRPLVCVIIIVVIVLPSWIAVIGTFWGVPAFEKQISELQTENSKNKQDFSDAKRDYEFKIQELTQARDKADEELAPWKLLANS
jgi:hypothetical protein